MYKVYANGELQKEFTVEAQAHEAAAALVEAGAINVYIEISQ